MSGEGGGDCRVASGKRGSRCKDLCLGGRASSSMGDHYSVRLVAS